MSDSDSERRPRPQYGEYASPEEQRAAIKQPAEWQLEEPHAQPAPAQPPQPSSPPPPPGVPLHWPQEESRPPQQPIARAGFGDRLITFVLLGFGLSNVLEVVRGAFDNGQIMRESIAAVSPGYEQFANGLPSWLWQGQAIIYGVVWLITLVTALSAMRAGRRSWWIPLLGAFVAGVLFFAIFGIAVGQNPELLNILPSPSPTGTGSST